MNLGSSIIRSSAAIAATGVILGFVFIAKLSSQRVPKTIALNGQAQPEREKRIFEQGAVQVDHETSDLHGAGAITQLKTDGAFDSLTQAETRARYSVRATPQPIGSNRVDSFAAFNP